MQGYRGWVAGLLAVALSGTTACKKSVEAVKSDLGEAGYQLSAEDWFRASRENDVAALKKFAAAKFPLDRLDAAGSSALHAAAAAGAKGSAGFLLDHGLAIDQRGADGRTPLMNAVLAGQTEMVAWLLRQGADPRIQDEQGFKPLMLGVREGQTASVVELAPYDRQNLDSALLLAAMVGQVGVIDALTNYGASVYAKMDDGRTPLMVAAQNGHFEAVKLLSDLGSSRFTTNPEGQTAADLATAAGHPVIAAWLSRDPAPGDFTLDTPAMIASALVPSESSPATGAKIPPVPSIAGATLSPRVAPPKLAGERVQAADGDDFSMPPVVMRSYREKELPISVRSVQAGTATVRLGGATPRDVKVKSGDRIPGTELVVLGMRRRMENSKVSLGETVEISTVTVRDRTTNHTREWIAGIPASAHDPVALVEDTATGNRYVVAPGQKFTDADGHSYLVSEIRPDQVIIQDVASGGVRTIRLRGPRG